MMTETEELLWIASQETNMIPKQVVRFATENNKSLAEVLYMEKTDFHGVDESSLQKFLEKREEIPINVCQRIFDHMHKNCASLITYSDNLFPSALKKLNEKDIPNLLYHQGKRMKYQNCIAIVGTRNCSTHAVETARELARSLAKLGYVIVSGLARGIDAAAHRGAISVGGTTVAVLPWIHEPYPPEHEQLLKEIKQHGSAISENFFPTQRMDKYKFIQRNGIISGISEALIAVESSFSGGTRWQVELALSQGKIVIAMEPEESNELSYDGFTKFVKKGAKKASIVSEAVKIIEKEVKIQAQSLDEFDFEEKVELKPLIEQ